MILAAVIIARNPTLYGFDVAPADAAGLRDASTVRTPSTCGSSPNGPDVSVEDIQELNPELRRTTTPSNAHELKVPMGTAATLEAKLATADPSLFATFKFHTVKRGETIVSVARQFKLTSAELRAANDLTSTSKVRAGQTLMIPQPRASGLPARPRRPPRQRRAGRVVAGDAPTACARATRSRASPASSTRPSTTSSDSTSCRPTGSASATSSPFDG